MVTPTPVLCPESTDRGVTVGCGPRGVTKGQNMIQRLNNKLILLLNPLGNGRPTSNVLIQIYLFKLEGTKKVVITLAVDKVHCVGHSLCVTSFTSPAHTFILEMRSGLRCAGSGPRSLGSWSGGGAGGSQDLRLHPASLKRLCIPGPLFHTSIFSQMQIAIGFSSEAD